MEKIVRILQKKNYWQNDAQQEIDLVETRGDEIAAFEFKWGDKTPQIPRAFATTYPTTIYQVINRNNYLEFI